MGVAVNEPRWRGDAGFYEIWFLVLFHPKERRAWWLRFTTFAPRDGGAPLAIQWFAAFDGPRAPLVVKEVTSARAWRTTTEGMWWGDSEVALGEGRVRGKVAGAAWDLRIERASGVTLHREPAWLRALPLPVAVEHAFSDVRVSGSVTVGSEQVVVDGAVGLQKHIWGRRRVAVLDWLYCPWFEDAPGVTLEATAVRLWRRAPAVTSLRVGAERRRRVRVWRSELFELRVVGAGVEARAWAPPATFVGYCYRDPRGWDAYVAQSDVASCEAVIDGERRVNRGHAALEIHDRVPLEGVSYRAWEGLA